MLPEATAVEPTIGSGIWLRHTVAVDEVRVPTEDIAFSIKVTLAILEHPKGDLTVTSIKGFPTRVRAG